MYLKEHRVTAAFGKPTKTSSWNYTMFDRIDKRVGNYMRNIHSTIFIGNFSPYPKGIIESFEKRKSFRKKLKKF